MKSYQPSFSTILLFLLFLISACQPAIKIEKINTTKKIGISYLPIENLNENSIEDDLLTYKPFLSKFDLSIENGLKYAQNQADKSGL
jgi:hypothetical protein